MRHPSATGIRALSSALLSLSLSTHHGQEYVVDVGVQECRVQVLVDGVVHVDGDAEHRDEEEPRQCERSPGGSAVAGDVARSDVDALLREDDLADEGEARHGPTGRHQVVGHGRRTDGTVAPPLEGGDVALVLQVEVEQADQLVETDAHAQAARLQVDQEAHDGRVAAGEEGREGEAEWTCVGWRTRETSSTLL